MSNKNNKNYEIPEPPEHLSQKSQRIWKELVGKKVKAQNRLVLFQVALESLDRSDECREIILKDGLTTNEKGKILHVHPLLKVEKDSRQLFGKLWRDLGLIYEPATNFTLD